MINSGSLYSRAGVDIEAADRAKLLMKKYVESTYNGSVVSGHGGFGGMYSLKELTGTNAILVGSSDGVGTKLKLAFMTGRHNTIGQDLVNHCVDDILCCGARPLFFFDYLGTGKIIPETVTQIIEGLSIACKENDMALLGGETAEMPGFYSEGEYDLAGFIVGWVEKDKVIDGSTIAPGDLLIGLESAGLHTNGYSLARQAFFEMAGMKPDDIISETGSTVGDELMKIHMSYLPVILALLDSGVIKGIAHITGGGFKGNINRIMPHDVTAIVKTSSWEVPGVFKAIARIAKVSSEEMYRVFNMGIGLVLICDSTDYAAITKETEKAGIRAYEIGYCDKGKEKVKLEF